MKKKIARREELTYTTIDIVKLRWALMKPPADRFVIRNVGSRKKLIATGLRG